VIEGTKPGDEVTVWFENANGKRRSSRFTCEAKSESRRRVLVVADENYTGPVSDPDPNGGPYAGQWNAFTGNSQGWRDWTVDLSAYAGKRVEVAISVITDWGTLGLGAGQASATSSCAGCSSTSGSCNQGAHTSLRV
jgi:hypothetical protein